MSLGLTVCFQEIIDLPIIKNRTYVINIDLKQSKEIHWVSLLIDRSTSLYFDSCWIENIPKQLLNKIKDKSITGSIFRMQSDDLILLYHFHRIYDYRENLVRLYQFIFS